MTCQLGSTWGHGRYAWRPPRGRPPIATRSADWTRVRGATWTTTSRSRQRERRTSWVCCGRKPTTTQRRRKTSHWGHCSVGRARHRPASGGRSPRRSSRRSPVRTTTAACCPTSRDQLARTRSRPPRPGRAWSPSRSTRGWRWSTTRSTRRRPGWGSRSRANGRWRPWSPAGCRWRLRPSRSTPAGTTSVTRPGRGSRTTGPPVRGAVRRPRRRARADGPRAR